MSLVLVASDNYVATPHVATKGDGLSPEPDSSQDQRGEPVASCRRHTYCWRASFGP